MNSINIFYGNLSDYGVKKEWRRLFIGRKGYILRQNLLLNNTRLVIDGNLLVPDGIKIISKNLSHLAVSGNFYLNGCIVTDEK